jgi:hypothetical protein
LNNGKFIYYGAIYVLLKDFYAYGQYSESFASLLVSIIYGRPIPRHYAIWLETLFFSTFVNCFSNPNYSCFKRLLFDCNRKKRSCGYKNKRLWLLQFCFPPQNSYKTHFPPQNSSKTHSVTFADSYFKMPVLIVPMYRFIWPSYITVLR